MEKYQKISSIMIFFNIIVYSFITTDLCITSFLMKDAGSSAWMIYLIYLLPIILIFLFYKKSTSIPKINKFHKFLIFIYTCMRTGCMFYYSSLILALWFYPQTEQFVFIIASLILIIWISLKKDYIIFSVGFAFAIASFGFALINLSVTTTHNLKLLLPLSKPDNLLKMIYILIIPFDNLLYSFYNDSYKKPLSKSMLIFTVIITILASVISILDNYTIVTYKYYLDLPLPSINRYFMSSGDKIFQHLDIILFFYSFIATIYKGAFYYKLNQKLFPKFKKKYLLTIASIISLSIAYLIISYSRAIPVMLIIASLVLSYLAIILLRRKDEIENAN